MKIKIILSSIGIYLLLIGIAIIRFGINKPTEQEYIEQQKELVLDSAPVVGDIENFYIGDWMDMRASKYCACAICCDFYTGITASGAHVQANHTIAAPSWLAFGTWIEIQSDIPGVSGYYKVEDRGGAIKGDRLDIYVDNHNEADAFGIHPVKMRIISENLTKY